MCVGCKRLGRLIHLNIVCCFIFIIIYNSPIVTVSSTHPSFEIERLTRAAADTPIEEVIEAHDACPVSVRACVCVL
jgi:hypothetical protein